MNIMRRLRDNLLGRRGSVVVEFAVFFPVLLIIFMGTVEMATAYRTEAKLNALVANVANMVSVSQAVTTAQPPNTDATVAAPYASFGSTVQTVSLPDMCAGAALGVTPYPSDGMTLDIASITQESATLNDEWEYDQTANGGVCSASLGGNGKVILNNATDTGAANGMINVPCDNVIIVHATLLYSGLFGLFINSPLTLTQTAYVRWSIAQAKTELMCAGCTMVSGGSGATSSLAPVQSGANKQICQSTNTAIN